MLGPCSAPVQQNETYWLGTQWLLTGVALNADGSAAASATAMLVIANSTGVQISQTAVAGSDGSFSIDVNAATQSITPGVYAYEVYSFAADADPILLTYGVLTANQTLVHQFDVTLPRPGQPGTLDFREPGNALAGD